MNISVNQVYDVLKSMYKVRSELVPCFIGAPGIGKTQSIYKFADEIGVNVVTFILSNTVPSEVSGIRMPDKESKKMEIYDDLRMASLKDGDILFFDEFLEAPALWSACLTLIQDRIMASGRKFPDIFIVAASNPVTSPGIISASTRNRFQFFNVVSNFSEWKEYFQNKYGIEVPDELRRYIETDSDQYNILTPREVEKLYLWAKEDSSNFVFDCIGEMFELSVRECIFKMVNYVPSPRQQIKNALIDIEGVELPDNFTNMSYKEILETLSSLSQWDKIQEALSSITLEEL